MELFAEEVDEQGARLDRRTTDLTVDGDRDVDQRWPPMRGGYLAAAGAALPGGPTRRAYQEGLSAPSAAKPVHVVPAPYRSRPGAENATHRQVSPPPWTAAAHPAGPA
jgi:hypothetical protein